MPQWIHRFGSGMAAVGSRDPSVVGRKGAGLAKAAHAGLLVPPGFTLSTAACRAFEANGGVMPTEIAAAVESAVRSIEAATGSSLGSRGKSGTRQLTLVVRPSPAEALALPGIIRTVRDLGLSAESPDQERAARAEAGYLVAVHGVDDADAEEAAEADRPFEELARLADAAGGVPHDPMERLMATLAAGFSSWGEAAGRQVRPVDIATGSACSLALIVQASVESVAQNVTLVGGARTRNAKSGEPGIRGFYARDVPSVSEAAPHLIGRLAKREVETGGSTLEDGDPELFARIEAAGRVLERVEAKPIDMKFAVAGRRNADVWILHAAVAPLEARAGIRVAVDLVKEGLIDESEAILRVEPNSLDQVLHARVTAGSKRTLVATGLSSSPGAASGTIVFTSEEALEARRSGRGAVFVCTETGPDDIMGIQAADAVVTARGGRASHAAVVARGLGRPCVTGAAAIRIDQRKRTVQVGDWCFGPDDLLTVDGNTGEVLLGALDLDLPNLTGDFATLMEWADNLRRLRVRANADTPEDAEVALRFGAEGIGLCRTEHMFFDTHRMEPMREMILADTAEERHEAIARMLPFQRRDFVRIFELMSGLPVMIRLLDPPLHEFLPKTANEMTRAAEALGVPLARMRQRVEALRETNPMLGHRGCRLAISYPEIARMQFRAALEAASDVQGRTGRAIQPEIMVPLVSMRDELDYVRDILEQTARDVERETGETVRYRIGTMIELPRAALRADAIAETAEFFSFGTNDLTQTTFGISRDDASPFLGRYRELGLMEHDPFATLDTQGVGELIRIACDKGRAARPDIALSICGEHGGDPASIAFCDEIGLDYVSCSPYRVPVARLAAAQAAVRAAAADAVPTPRRMRDAIRPIIRGLAPARRA